MSATSRWTTVLWDMDGTIVDASVGIMRRIGLTLARFGIAPPTPEQLPHWIGPPLLSGFRDNAGMTPNQAAEAVAFYRTLAQGHAESGEAVLYAGVEELIRDVHATGIPQAIASSKLESQVVDLLTTFRLTPYFSAAAGASADEISRTAKADIVEVALQRLRERGVDTSCPVLVGDRRHDVEGGRLAGVPVIFVRWGFGDPGEEAGSIAAVQTVDALRALLLP